MNTTSSVRVFAMIKGFVIPIIPAYIAFSYLVQRKDIPPVLATGMIVLSAYLLQAGYIVLVKLGAKL